MSTNKSFSTETSERYSRALFEIGDEAGEIEKIEICLDSKSFSTWDIKNHQWEIKKGMFNILIGSSSNDIKLKDSINL